MGTATEASDYLRLLYAKIGHVFCQKCGREVIRDTPQSAAGMLASLAPGTRYIVAFPWTPSNGDDLTQSTAALVEDGFVRVVAAERMIDLSAEPLPPLPCPAASSNGNGSSRKANGGVYVVVDRLTAGSTADDRVRDSLETAFAKGHGRCSAFVADEETADSVSSLPGSRVAIDGRSWRRVGFTAQLSCGDCGLEYAVPEPRLYSFNSPLGACPVCEGFGNVIDMDMDLVVPIPRSRSAKGRSPHGPAPPIAMS